MAQGRPIGEGAKGSWAPKPHDEPGEQKLARLDRSQQTATVAKMLNKFMLATVESCQQDALWEEGQQAEACWETSVHVNVTLTCTTYLNTAVHHAHPFMATVLPDGRGLFQQDHASCHTKSSRC